MDPHIIWSASFYLHCPSLNVVIDTTYPLQRIISHVTNKYQSQISIRMFKYHRKPLLFSQPFFKPNSANIKDFVDVTDKPKENN